MCAGGLDVVKRKAKEWFYKNRDLADEVEIKRAVARGRYTPFPLFWGDSHVNSFSCATCRWYVRNELTAVIQFKKYRVMRERYSQP
jgi:hypothetical protein